MSIVKNLFGHTGYKHNLGRDVDIIKKVYGVSVGQKIWWKSKGITYGGKITSKNNIISVGNRWRIPYVSVLLSEPTGDVISEVIDINNIKNSLSLGKIIQWVDKNGVTNSGKIIRKNPDGLFVENNGKLTGIPYEIILIEKQI